MFKQEVFNTLSSEKCICVSYAVPVRIDFQVSDASSLSTRHLVLLSVFLSLSRFFNKPKEEENMEKTRNFERLELSSFT